MISGILHESWLGKVVAGWDHVRKLNAFKEHYLAWSDTIVSRWNFCARNEIFSFAFLLFLWDNASQKLRIPSHFAKCELLIRTFLWIEFVFHFFFFLCFCFLLGYAFAQLLSNALKPIPLLLKWKNNAPPEYEACYSSSIPNNLTKSQSTPIFLLTLFSATNASTTIFSLGHVHKY